MKKKILTIILAIVAIMIIVAGIIILTRGNNAKDDGVVTIEVISLDESIVKSKDISFKKGDNLTNLIKNNFDSVIFEGTMLMNIETLVTPSDWSTYICVYKNDEMSNVGIGEIVFTNSDKITLKMVVNNYA